MSAHDIRSTWSPDGDTATVRVEDVYDTGIDDLWDAVTTPERLARWIAVVEGDAVLGGTVTARFTSHWHGTGVIEVCEAPHRFTVRWDAEGQSAMSAELTAEGDRTRLVILDHGIPVSEVRDHVAGWHVHLEDLGAVLDGREPGSWEDRWRELIPRYRDQAPTA